MVTRDAGPKCAAVVKSGLRTMYDKRSSKEGRQTLAKVFRLCDALDKEDDVINLMGMVSSAWDYLAMGDFPYPSRYVQPEGATLPAYPVAAACKLVVSADDPVGGLADAANLFYNASTTKRCLFDGKSKTSKRLQSRKVFSEIARFRRDEDSRECKGDWDWQWCTEHNMPFTSGTDKDMFFPPTGAFDPVATANLCKDTWGVEPNPLWARLTYGGLEGLKKGLTNVVFSNGMLDPWSAGGVLDTDGFDPSVVAIHIPHGAHHLDLMFSNERDPLDVKLARATELRHITWWIQEAIMKKGSKVARDNDAVLSTASVRSQ